MQSVITEPERRLEVKAEQDVVVIGGGVAGVAAAIAAARHEASVILIEKQSALGGLATLGNVIVYLPLCDGMGTQVIGGLGEELLKLSVADIRRENRGARFVPIPQCWLHGGSPEERRNVRYLAEFNPASFLLALEKLLVESGVKLLYDTRFCAVRTEAGRISHVIVENKSGRFAIACGTVVDCTGDADVSFAAGEATESLDSNVLAGWFYLLENGAAHLQYLSNPYDPRAGRENAVGPFFRGDDGDQVTAHLLGTRELVRQHIARHRAQHPDKEIYPLQLPTIACFRMTRRLRGTLDLSEQHCYQWFPDTIGMVGDWRSPGPVYAIPFRSLCGVRSRNLLVAGRCISVDATAWDVTRAIPACVVTGEAAGTAAALAARLTDADVSLLDTARLQEQLRRQKVLLDPARLASEGGNLLRDSRA